MLSKIINFFRKKQEQFWWHSPSAEFDEFDFNKIGSTSLKYGWGIYFSHYKHDALRHNKGLNHIYRLPLTSVESKSFIFYSKQIKEHKDPKVIEVARSFYGADKFDQDNFYKGGHRFYNDIWEFERSKGKNSNGCAAKYLLDKGITGGIIDDNGERIIVIYDTDLWKNVERIQVEETHNKQI
ncbi:hypothetical protein [Pseudomonas sp. H3(2019)]|uniref:hypothetical protein n=1 Tax=Pseudomonas sp. H3(2019) TaxID=2598724 RepID=UPI001191CE04|nr:hypothetical protein [Pseudomonas sp. H3(2019)]TVT85093.1 hypothetical protein FPT12_05540 [Pseudomonas sp. H3(2019)]